MSRVSRTTSEDTGVLTSDMRFRHADLSCMNHVFFMVQSWFVRLYICCGLQAEGIQQQLSLSGATPLTPLLTTILCFVLKNRATGEHTFCSQYDFGPWPLLQRHVPEEMHTGALKALQSARVVMINGCLFDELPVEAAISLVANAQATGAAIFFDPGALSQAWCSTAAASSSDTLLFWPLCPEAS
jgi:hypothetical protein